MTELERLQLLDALQAVLRPHLERSEPLRTLTRLLGEFLIDEARRATSLSGASAALPAPGSAPTSVPPAEPPEHRPAITTRPVSAALVPLKIGDATIHVPVQGTTTEIGRARASAQPVEEEPPPAADHPLNLGLIVQRSKLKADSCRLYIDRRAAEGDPVREPPLLDRMRDMIARGKSMPSCFMWVFWKEESQPDDATLRSIATCYEALAAAAALMQRLDEHADRADPADVADGMALMAEACSGLRVALQATWLRRPDSDQDDAHLWLRRETAVRRILVSRYMRLDDPADPSRAAALIEDIRALEARIVGRIDHVKKIAGHLQKVRYHADQMIREVGDPAHHARQIETAVEALGAHAVPPTDTRLVSLISAELLARWPQAMIPGARLGTTFNAARAALATGDDEPQTAAPRAWSPRVLEVRELLERRDVVIVGGEPRQDAIRRLADAFGLEESGIIWVHLSEHASGAPMRAPIQHPRTGLVLVLIKLTGHLHAEEANQYARDAGKAYVYLKAGYNPEQVAEAVLTQAGEQLRRTAGAA